MELITGERVTATTPETTTAAARVMANSRNSEPVSPPWNAIGVYTVASVIVMAMIGPDQLACPDDRRVDSRSSLAHVSLDVLDHDDRVVYDQAHRQHDGEDRQQVEAEAERRT